MATATIELSNVRQASFFTTLMGVARGVFDYYGIDVSDAFLFGASGHAFVINIHKDLCPSGPYVWNQRPIRDQLAKLGVRMASVGVYGPQTQPDERDAAEAIVTRNLDAGQPCALLHLENQIITGYDEENLFTTQPWDGMDFPPKSWARRTWRGQGDRVPVEFFTFEPTEPVDPASAVLDSLRFAVQAYRHPEIQTHPDYGFGPLAYRNWQSAVENGHGAEHGNWWNGSVWSECRRQAADYFTEIAPLLGTADLSASLSDSYRSVAELLKAAADKELPAADKVEKLKAAHTTEESAIGRIETLLKENGHSQ